MKLFHGGGSPFVRKVMVVAHETGQVDKLELLDGGTTPVETNPELAKVNPIGKIPALILDDGTALSNSPVICEYLDSQHAGAKMVPASGADRWEALRLQAVCDGLMDAAVNNRYETMVRPEGMRWDAWSAGQLGKVDRAIDALEAAADSLGDRVDIGTISVGCACGYLDFRYDDRNWRGSHPKLAAWYATFGQRASMQATTPPSA
jgi:glutathione S-transferase